jgi:hypothetical protein
VSRGRIPLHRRQRRPPPRLPPDPASACAPFVAAVALGSRALPPAAATPPNVALPWSPPLRGDELPEGTATVCGAESAANRVADPPAGAPGGLVLQPATALPQTPVECKHLLCCLHCEWSCRWRQECCRQRGRKGRTWRRQPAIRSSRDSANSS